jgi:hypothetical protein
MQDVPSPHRRALGQRPSGLPVPPWAQQHPAARGAHRAKNLYIREDRMLAVLAVHLPGRSPTELAQHLRSNNLVIVCDAATWTIAEGDCLTGAYTESSTRSELVGQPPGAHAFMG